MTIDYHTTDAEKYLVCYNPDLSFYECVYTTQGQFTTTGQPFMQEFDTFAEAKTVFGDYITDPTPIGV